MDIRAKMRYMNPYDIHKMLVNEYILQKPGDTRLLKRDTSRDKTDLDVIRENHKFLWDDKAPSTWEEQFAKKYYDKLFKEYCISDLSLYKENKIALRWRTEQEVIIGRGQFTCSNRKCQEKELLRTWEVNFAYKEHGEKKNALVKIRLCPNCSAKLNYRSKKREVKRLEQKQLIGQKKKKKRHRGSDEDKSDKNTPSSSKLGSDEQEQMGETSSKVDESPWENLKPVETKSRDEEMEDYLQELLL